jgi:DNA polymerase III delta prime subunit
LKFDLGENMINDTQTEFLWAQKYRPQKVEDTILPAKTKVAFQKFVNDKKVPNLLLAGPPGTGKTTAAIAMLKELDCDYIKINGSLNGGIDTLRYEISNFASSVSFSGGRKYVIIDEADYLTINTQTALRGFIEDYSKNCGFIFTCNFKNRIIEPLRGSRFSVVDFVVDKEERPKLAAQFFKRVMAILKSESVESNPQVVAKIIEKHFPDFRRVLNELQKYAAAGKIDEGIFSSKQDADLNVLFEYLKEKKFTDMRKWVADNSDQDANEMFRSIYDLSMDKIELKSMPGFVVTLADYMYKHAFVADPEINLVAFLTEVMIETSFK